MITHLSPVVTEPVVTMADTLVYAQKKEWCGATWKQLKLSIVRPRDYFYYDKKEKLPVLLVFCGGGFKKMDRNVWMPEMSYYAKHGWAVVSVDYETAPETRFPDWIVEGRQAIRFLRAHKEELRLDTDHIVAFGESAGGYMSSFLGALGSKEAYDEGDYLDQSGTVCGAVNYYAVTEPHKPDTDPKSYRAQMPNVPGLVGEWSAPCMLLHGTTDSQVDLAQSEHLYEAMQKAGKRAEMLILDGAEHADAPFFQTEVKERILAFMNSLL